MPILPRRAVFFDTIHPYRPLLSNTHRMANLTPPPPAKARSPAASSDAAKPGDGFCRPTSPDVLVDATGRTAPSNPGWTVKHVSAKDAAMNAAKVPVLHVQN